jgi:hypothetical protein
VGTIAKIYSYNEGLKKAQACHGSTLRAVEYTRIEIELAWGKDLVSVAWVVVRGNAAQISSLFSLIASCFRPFCLSTIFLIELQGSWPTEDSHNECLVY